jgi:hypothetical protein
LVLVTIFIPVGCGIIFGIILGIALLKVSFTTIGGIYPAKESWGLNANDQKQAVW